MVGQKKQNVVFVSSRFCELVHLPDKSTTAACSLTARLPCFRPAPQPNNVNELPFQIALLRVPGVGAATAKTLIAYCGSASAIFAAKRAALLAVPGIGPQIAEQILATNPHQLAESELRFLDTHGAEALFFTDPRFPHRLKTLVDGPVLLFVKTSDLSLLNAPRVVGVVGTRQPTEQGRAICEEMVEGLQAYNTVIVSGLAYGVDITAHRRATALGIPNFGVLGHGLGSIYPAAHRSTALKMMENGGLISEFGHDEGPDREHFPRRNRVISGLCDALLVVETAAEGGSMITAEFARRHLRTVLAVPGRPHDPKSVGCNQLIKDERATLVESAADIARVMQWDSTGSARTHAAHVQAQLLLDLPEEELRIVHLIREQPDILIDDLSHVAQLPPGELAAHLLSLEFRGVIRTQPGKRYRALY
jgi:DNA processing protein